jgi:hypothetical protein
MIALALTLTLFPTFISLLPEIKLKLTPSQQGRSQLKTLLRGTTQLRPCYVFNTKSKNNKTAKPHSKPLTQAKRRPLLMHRQTIKALGRRSSTAKIHNQHALPAFNRWQGSLLKQRLALLDRFTAIFLFIITDSLLFASARKPTLLILLISEYQIAAE